MKITIPQNRPESKPRPTFPSVHLTDEAYDALFELSIKYNISMRQLASKLIVEACNNLEIDVGGEQDA